jgi:hypothetical protein
MQQGKLMGAIMDNFTRADLEKLSVKKDWALSVYLPTFDMQDKTKQNPVFLKDLIPEIAERLRKKDVDENEINFLGKKIQDLANDVNFWLYSSTALCIFATKTELYVYRLDIEVSQLVIIDTYFFVLPLFTALENIEYYFLTINEAGPRLFLGDKYNFQDISSNELESKTIKGIRDFLDVEEVPGFHLEARGGREQNKENVIFHGHGNEKDDREIRLRQLILSIISALPKGFSEDNRPLIVVGPEEEISLFKKHYHYHNLSGTMNYDTELL